MRKIVVGSRKSNLALTQTKWVIEQLKKAGIKNEFEVKKIVTKGDRILDTTLSKVGGKGLFVKEIEQAMYDKTIDFAVHSMKDMPAILPDGLVISSIPVREDHRDVLVSKNDLKLADLPEAAIIGTSSLRRGAQILNERPDLKIKWIRGNIETRLRKLHEEDYDAIILAASGMKRVGMDDKLITEYLDPAICIPAVGQGALAIECREDDHELHDILGHIHDEKTATCVQAERTFLGLLEGGCQIPIGGYASIDADGLITLSTLVGTPDGETILKEIVSGNDPIKVGTEAANRMKDKGAAQIIASVKEELDE
ncbi:MAG TPA: hydroxymethylbilane synthase [Cerasibacillus sp.]|uniref:hydroxymethylbilane synthase n=1 Tax=Cerasibacillus sp. TaxID=2498711 RepID=UPI002F3E420F